MALSEPKLMDFKGILQYRLFEIPEYQRGYCWTSKERRDLFDDLLELFNKYEMNNASEHFMATLVLQKIVDNDKGKGVETDSGDKLIFHEVVDGQQRLTTLVILLKAVEKNLNENDPKNKALTELAGTFLKAKNNLIVYHTHYKTNETLRNYLTNGQYNVISDTMTLSEKEMIGAFKDCENFVKNQKDPSKILTVLKNNLKFILFVIEDKGSGYTVFEVLNSRGLNVNWLDKMKSTLMGIAFEKGGNRSNNDLEDIGKAWALIYDALGKELVADADVLTIAANLISPKPESKGYGEEDAFRFFKEHSCEDNMKPLDTSRLFLDVVNSLNDSFKDPRIKAICGTKQSRLLLASIRLSKALTKKKPKEQDTVLSAWENAMFKFFVLGANDARDKVGQCIKLAQKIYKCTTLSIIDINGELDEIFKIDFEEMKTKLGKTDVYDKWNPSEIIYFFEKYEESLSAKAKNGGKIDQKIWTTIWENESKAQSVEHIYPQKGDGSKKTDWEPFLHRLGNLMVLPIDFNQSVGAKIFKEKVARYKELNNWHYVAEVIKFKEWTPKAVVKRENMLMEFAKHQWWPKLSKNPK